MTSADSMARQNRSIALPAGLHGLGGCGGVTSKGLPRATRYRAASVDGRSISSSSGQKSIRGGIDRCPRDRVRSQAGGLFRRSTFTPFTSSHVAGICPCCCMRMMGDSRFTVRPIFNWFIPTHLISAFRQAGIPASLARPRAHQALERQGRQPNVLQRQDAKTQDGAGPAGCGAEGGSVSDRKRRGSMCVW